MKRLALAASICLVLVGLSAQSREKWLGTVRSLDGGSFNNTTSPDAGFSLGFGLKLEVQCSAAACVIAGTGADAGVTCSEANSNKGPKYAADTIYPLRLDSATNAVAQVPVSGTADCDVYQVIP